MLEIKEVVSNKHEIKDGKICFVVESCSFDQFCKSYSVHLGKEPILVELTLSLSLSLSLSVCISVYLYFYIYHNFVEYICKVIGAKHNFCTKITLIKVT